MAEPGLEWPAIQRGDSFDAQLRRAAQNDSAALYYLGVAALTGQGVCEDMELARAWLRAASEKRHPGALRERAWLEFDVWPDESFAQRQAVETLRKLARAGDAEAAFYLALGRHGLAGIYGEREWGEIEHAADAGSEMARRSIAMARRVRPSTVRWLRHLAETPNVTNDATRSFDLGGRRTSNHTGEQWPRKAWFDGPADFAAGLALLYAEGIGVEKSEEAALHWYVIGAEQGSTSAALEAGRILMKTGRSRANREEALRWFRVGARNGDEDAMFELGRALVADDEAPAAVREGEAWLRRAAFTKHCAEASELLGRRYVRRQGVSPDDKLRLGECYDSLWGMPFLPSDHDKALRWYAAAADAGIAEADYKIGRLYLGYAESMGYDREDAGRHAVLRFEKAARLGHVPAQCAYGLANSWWWFSNRLPAERDPERCVRWLRKAAESGYPQAQLVLGLCYERGYGVGRNKRLALEWLARAAKRRTGLAAPEWDYWLDLRARRSALETIGRLTTDGSESGTRLRWGVRCLRVAYDENNSGEAAFLLGEVYAAGRGVPRSQEVANAWYRRAADLRWDAALELLRNGSVNR